MKTRSKHEGERSGKRSRRYSGS